MKLGGRVVLNDPPSPRPEPVGGEIAEELEGRVLHALATYATAAGRIDYARLRTSIEFRQVIECARRLHGVELARLNGRDARLAFWINVYDALVVHGIVALGIRGTVREFWNFFGRVSYRVEGIVLSLDDIEHGILRGNRRRAMPPWRPFGRHDGRRALALDLVDPRIHFAINCGARSCPPVGTYRASGIDGQLELAARNFVNQEVALDSRGRVECSKIFKWYRSDFGREHALTEFLLRYLDAGPVKTALEAGVLPCRVYRPYSWALGHPPAE